MPKETLGAKLDELEKHANAGQDYLDDCGPNPSKAAGMEADLIQAIIEAQTKYIQEQVDQQGREAELTELQQQEMQLAGQLNALDHIHQQQEALNKEGAAEDHPDRALLAQGESKLNADVQQTLQKIDELQPSSPQPLAVASTGDGMDLEKGQWFKSDMDPKDIDAAYKEIMGKDAKPETIDMGNGQKATVYKFDDPDKAKQFLDKIGAKKIPNPFKEPAPGHDREPPQTTDRVARSAQSAAGTGTSGPQADSGVDMDGPS